MGASFVFSATRISKALDSQSSSNTQQLRRISKRIKYIGLFAAFGLFLSSVLSTSAFVISSTNLSHTITTPILYLTAVFYAVDIVTLVLFSSLFFSGLKSLIC